MALRRGAKLGWLALAGAGLAMLATLWSYREPIAKDAIDGYLARHGVKASYEIKAIETRRQRLEHVRIGAAAAPDLLADWVEIDVGPSLTGLTIKAVRAGGVRLRARYDGKKISMGALDRLLPPPSDAPFRLPDVDLSLEDARARLESPVGPIGVRLDGQGNLRAGFEGTLAAVAPRLAFGTCRTDQATAYGDVSVVGSRPTFVGPLRFEKLQCDRTLVRKGVVMLNAGMAENGSDWRGALKAQLPFLDAPQGRMAGLTGDVRFNGDARQTKFFFDARLNTLAAPDVQASGLSLGGRATLLPNAFLVAAKARANDVRVDAQARDLALQLRTMRQAALIGPLAGQMQRAVEGLSRGTSINLSVSLARNHGQLRFSASDLRLESQTGARLQWDGKDAFVVGPAGIALNGQMRFGGGHFPQGRAQFRGQTGQIFLAPYKAGRAELRLSPIDLGWDARGLGVRTRVALDGPVGDGRLTDLQFPFVIRPGQHLPDGCWPVRFRSAIIGGAHLSRHVLQTCLHNGAVRFVRPHLKGRLGSSPFLLAAQGVTGRIKGGQIRVTNADLQWTTRDGPSRFALGSLFARPANKGWAGSLSGLDGFSAAIPLAARDGAGQWTFANGRAQWRGQAAIEDRAASPRFNPLLADALQARLIGQTITAEAVLKEPVRGATAVQVALRHDVSSGRGSASLEVPSLEFGDRLQPEALTPVTLGVVANVRGQISGQGRIDWGPDGVTSFGRFATKSLDYAAAFGPVTGMAGEIEFTDLLNLVTAPNQALRIAAINPGVLVMDGQIRYHILPGFKVAVDGGQWPFAGGYLKLERTILDMSEAAERRLTFTVEGLDAARFIAAMDFENIAATGVYDGTLPMVFDANGGRIEGGRLVARGGGTLSYVGPVSNGNLGLMGRFAFDALKSMRYERLAIDLNGAIDGDVITRISFAGVNQAPVTGGRTKLPIKVLGVSNLPFVFNVTISAKFRQLFDMARSFNDPSILINRLVPSLEPMPKPPTEKAPPVQPLDSPPKQ